MQLQVSVVCYGSGTSNVTFDLQHYNQEDNLSCRQSVFLQSVTRRDLGAGTLDLTRMRMIRGLKRSQMPGLYRLYAKSIQGHVPQPFSTSSAVLWSWCKRSPDAMVKCVFHQDPQIPTEACCCAHQ